MAFRLAHWHEIETSKRCFMTLHTGERVYYAVLGFSDMQTCNGVMPYARIRPEGGPSADVGIYPVKALVFELPSGELVK